MESSEKPSAAINEKLQRENYVLRSQLLQVQSKLARVMEITQRLSVAIEATTKSSRSSHVLHSSEENETHSLESEEVCDEVKITSEISEPHEPSLPTALASLTCPATDDGVPQG